MFCVIVARSHQFLQEFLEVGGVLTVLEILSVKQARESDKNEALKLLHCVASAGRQYKEVICEGHGQRVVTRLLWSPYVIGQTIIFSSCFFLLLFFYFLA